MSDLALWISFGAIIVGMLAVDLGLLNRKAHAVGLREAAIWSGVVVTVAGLFNAWVFLERGNEAGLQFLAGYMVELALSVDNVFVFIMIFSYFRVPPAYHHRVLFWGIFGALVMRGLMITAGALLIERFHWITYVFGAFLVLTGIRMAMHDDVEIEPESNPILKLIRRFVPISASYDGQKFFSSHKDALGRIRRVATPLFVVLVMVETTDLVFAVDSIPAIFGITQDPFIVFTSNVFAILGLRSMYFLLAGVIDKFHYLKLGLSFVLTFVGIKMLLVYFHIHIPIQYSLGMVCLLLGGSVVASLIFPKKNGAPADVGHPPAPVP
jgi:tellurite resistance protein TerC